MKIGKLDFDEIVKLTFDNTKVLFTAKGLFIAMLIYICTGYIDNFLLNHLNLSWVSFFDRTASLAAILVIIGTMLGTTLLVKADLSKLKIKNISESIKPLFLKTVGVLIVYLLSLVVVLAGLWLIGQVGKLPSLGPIQNTGAYLMALVGIPAALFMAYFTVYMFITSKLIFIALVENQKDNILRIVQGLIDLTRKNMKKLAFNGMLALLPMFFLGLAILGILSVVYFMYSYFAWYVPGISYILSLCLNSGVNLLAFIVITSGAAVLAYALSFLVVMGVTAGYSIYLDAAK